MGRPPLRVKATTVRLPDGMSERIDGLVGANRRAEFIRSAVMKELRRRQATRKKRSTKAD
jgi:Arc/MetJ-type ribon-helix-helix transcriptional regulator